MVLHNHTAEETGYAEIGFAARTLRAMSTRQDNPDLRDRSLSLCLGCVGDAASSKTKRRLPVVMLECTTHFPNLLLPRAQRLGHVTPVADSLRRFAQDLVGPGLFESVFVGGFEKQRNNIHGGVVEVDRR